MKSKEEISGLSVHEEKLGFILSELILYYYENEFSNSERLRKESILNVAITRYDLRVVVMKGLEKTGVSCADRHTTSAWIMQLLAKELLLPVNKAESRQPKNTTKYWVHIDNCENKFKILSGKRIKSLQKESTTPTQAKQGDNASQEQTNSSQEIGSNKPVEITDSRMSEKELAMQIKKDEEDVDRIFGTN